MLQHPGNYIGDVWFFVKEDTAHAYYLTAPESGRRRDVWSIAHATSRDLINWQRHGIALHPGVAGEWDESALATGCIFEADGRFYMGYTGRNRQETGLAVSDDLFVWQKCPANPVTRLDARFYEPVGSGLRKTRHWRDPFIVRHDACWYQLTCASRVTGAPGARGVVGLAKSSDLATWEVIGPLDTEPFCQEMECPQLYFRNGKYHLVFSALADQILPVKRHQIGEENVWWTTYTMISDNFFGPYRLSAKPRIIPPAFPAQPYACQIATLGGQDYILGTVWGKDADPDFITDPLPVGFTGSGIIALLFSP
ncbi:beta-fructosidase, levanase/invertase [Opitutaceae bacterium TAV1]|nr:beta-fructosidase, levanase/invertase [Opitutaceae bacterium TAV1]